MNDSLLAGITYITVILFRLFSEEMHVIYLYGKKTLSSSTFLLTKFPDMMSFGELEIGFLLCLLQELI